MAQHQLRASPETVRIGVFDATFPPVLTIESGDRVVVQCVSGRGEEDVRTLRRAALIHDLGRLGVSNAIWDKAGSLTEAESERVRLHPYLTDRMLARVTALAKSREIASRHHERLDGSGYPRGLTAVSLTPSDRLLAAADVYHAMTEPRPHRPPVEPDQAARELRAAASAGRDRSPVGPAGP